MIYKDVWSKNDTNEYPGYRPALCLNCNQAFSSHWGWLCCNFPYGSLETKTKFSNLPTSKRFLTPGMNDSVDGPFANFSIPNIDCDCQKPGCENCVPTKRGEDL